MSFSVACWDFSSLHCCYTSAVYTHVATLVSWLRALMGSLLFHLAHRLKQRALASDWCLRGVLQCGKVKRSSPLQSRSGGNKWRVGSVSRQGPLFLSQHAYGSEGLKGHREAQAVQWRLNRLVFKIPIFTDTVGFFQGCGRCGRGKALATLGAGLRRALKAPSNPNDSVIYWRDWIGNPHP